MKFEKLTLGFAMATFLIAAANEAVAQPVTHAKKAPANVVAKKTLSKKVAPKTIAKTATPKAPTHAVKSHKLATPKAKSPQASNRTPVYKRLTPAINPYVTPMAAASTAAPNIRQAGVTKLKPEAQIAATLDTTNHSPAPAYKGTVDFTLGKDSNVDPDKRTPFHATYYQIAPNLGFESGRWSGTFGASLRDYSEERISDVYKQSEANASGSYKAKLSGMTTSTTTVNSLYHDEMWPDFINGTNGTPEDRGMSIRFLDVKLEQKLGFTFDSPLSLEVGGSAKNHNALSRYSDWASDVLEPKIYEKDNNEISAFGAIKLAAGKYVDFALKPSVTQIKYTQRDGRQPDGSVGGELNAAQAPKYELITSEIGFDTAFKFAESNITPKFVAGQVSDQALGAEDQSYWGMGLSSTLVLDPSTSLTLTPNVMYKKMSYDHWTSNSPNTPVKRVDNDIVAGVNASIKLAKNFGVGAGYSIIREKSTMDSDTSENYREEIVSSTLTFTF